MSKNYLSPKRNAARNLHLDLGGPIQYAAATPARGSTPNRLPLFFPPFANTPLLSSVLRI
jgi:hypothetical protein